MGFAAVPAIDLSCCSAPVSLPPAPSPSGPCRVGGWPPSPRPLSWPVPPGSVRLRLLPAAARGAFRCFFPLADDPFPLPPAPPSPLLPAFLPGWLVRCPVPSVGWIPSRSPPPVAPPGGWVPALVGRITATGRSGLVGFSPLPPSRRCAASARAGRSPRPPLPLPPPCCHFGRSTVAASAAGPLPVQGVEIAGSTSPPI